MYPDKLTEGGTLHKILAITSKLRYSTTTEACFHDRFKMVTAVLTQELERAYNVHIKPEYVPPYIVTAGKTVYKDPFVMLEEGEIDSYIYLFYSF